MPKKINILLVTTDQMQSRRRYGNPDIQMTNLDTEWERKLLANEITIQDRCRWPVCHA